MRTKMQSIRFSEDELIVLENIAQSRGKKLSAFVRECCFAHIHNITEHEKLLGSLKPEDSENTQKTFFEVLNNSNDTVLKTLEKIELGLSKKLELLDLLMRKEIYLHFFYNRDVSQEDYHDTDLSANRLIKEFLEDVDCLYKR